MQEELNLPGTGVGKRYTKLIDTLHQWGLYDIYALAPDQRAELARLTELLHYMATHLAIPPDYHNE